MSADRQRNSPHERRSARNAARVCSRPPRAIQEFHDIEIMELGFQGKLWQKSSYDRVMDLEKPFEEVVQYVLENPVRKGLVKDWSEWPYSKIVDPWWR